ncbi:organic hydroperoxide reductase OsmC/OhrA [Kribbella orskensis]|uniref:Organic hydroperoxide reductase OsmC/OhrA n=2 Tax=Kribbellaceae TaxID=2726069 RepID=A0ABY2BTE2_9ACTN|nr:organic hydroperoxide reductase OsmC/OhrA [Kribbella sp. VKM Ac-2500]TCO31500.1 organic hydroperoxide reductase OsmC/OhrA [Kribbella orskensis]
MTTVMASMASMTTDGRVAAGRTVTGTWRSGYHCSVRAGSFTIEVDEPVRVGGTDLGPQPTDLFLASVASCFLMALSYAARKREIELSDLSVDVTGSYDGQRFSAIHVRARVGVPGAELDQLVRAAERVCYVTNTLRAGVELTTEAIAVEH